jgi:hypothetical protein
MRKRRQEAGQEIISLFCFSAGPSCAASIERTFNAQAQALFL